MKIQKPVKHAHRKAMIAQKKAKGRYSRHHMPKSKSFKNDQFFFIHFCSSCFARGKTFCKDCVVWK